MRIIIAMLAFVALASGLAGQTLPYDGTYFVHGFADGPARFNGTPGGLAARGLDLRTVRLPDLSETALISTQSSELRNFLSAYRPFEDSIVIVGHSMGGVVARRTYLNNTAGIGALVTVGSPHRGAPVSSGGDRFARHMSTTAARAATGLFGWLGYFLGPVGHYWVNELVERIIELPLRITLISSSGFATPGAIDMRPASPTMQTLYAARGDGGLRRANVIGDIPHRNAVWKVLASAQQNDGAAQRWIDIKNIVKSYAKTCKHVAYATIVLYEQGRRCARLDRSIARIDDVWMGAVNGYSGGRPRSVPFDGLIPHDHSVYPSTLRVQEFRAVGSNHNNLTYSPQGLDAMRGALSSVGVRQF